MEILTSILFNLFNLFIFGSFNVFSFSLVALFSDKSSSLHTVLGKILYHEGGQTLEWVSLCG